MERKCAERLQYWHSAGSLGWPFPMLKYTRKQWRRQDFVTGGSEVWVYRGSTVRSPPVPVVYCLCINVALCSTAVQCICRVIRRSSITMKAHTYYIIFGRPPIGGSFPPFPLAAPLHGSNLIKPHSETVMEPALCQLYRHIIVRYVDWCVRRTQVIKMLLAIVLLFAICWSPTLLDSVLVEFGIVGRFHHGYLRYARHRSLHGRLTPVRCDVTLDTKCVISETFVPLWQSCPWVHFV